MESRFKKDIVKGTICEEEWDQWKGGVGQEMVMWA
jgi:hypothetical protein